MASTFSDSLTSAGTAFPASPNTIIPFEAERVTLTNTDATNTIMVAFGNGGAADAAALAQLQANEVAVPPSTTIKLDSFHIGHQTGFGAVACEVRVRSAAGTPLVILNADA